MRKKRTLLQYVLLPFELLLLSFASIVEATVTPPPRKNRRTRRREDWEARHEWTTYWRDVPWYKIPQYLDGWYKVQSDIEKRNKPFRQKPKIFHFKRYCIVTVYQQFVSCLMPIRYDVMKRNWFKWEYVASFDLLGAAEVYIEEQENA